MESSSWKINFTQPIVFASALEMSTQLNANHNEMERNKKYRSVLLLIALKFGCLEQIDWETFQPTIQVYLRQMDRNEHRRLPIDQVIYY